jgi:hypothetical protein
MNLITSFWIWGQNISPKCQNKLRNCSGVLFTFTDTDVQKQKVRLSSRHRILGKWKKVRMPMQSTFIWLDAAFMCKNVRDRAHCSHLVTERFAAKLQVVFDTAELLYFSIDNAHLMYNAYPKLFRHSFWCIDNAHDAN